MKIYKIRFNSVEEIKDFVQIISDYDFTADIKCGQYSVDAYSLLGLLTISIKKDIYLVIYRYEDENKLSEFLEKIKFVLIKK